MTEKEIKNLMGFNYASYPVSNPLLAGQPQENGSVSSRKAGGMNVYDGCQNWIGYFDADGNWNCNGEEDELKTAWKEAALKVLANNA